MGSTRVIKLKLNPEKVKDAVGTVCRNWIEVQPHLEGLNSLQKYKSNVGVLLNLQCH